MAKTSTKNRPRNKTLLWVIGVVIFIVIMIVIFSNIKSGSTPSSINLSSGIADEKIIIISNIGKFKHIRIIDNDCYNVLAFDIILIYKKWKLCI